MTSTALINEAVDAYRKLRGFDADPATLLWQLLVDARFYADAHGLDFGEIDRGAYEGYLEELHDL